MAVALSPRRRQALALVSPLVAGQEQGQGQEQGHPVRVAVQGQGRLLAAELLQPVQLEPLVLLLLLVQLLTVLQRRVTCSPERRAPRQRRRGQRRLAQ